MFFHDFPGKIRKSFGMVGVIERKTVQLTSAQIKALFTTPVQLIEAPGAGRVIQVISVVAKNDFASIAYTGANALEVRYTNGSGAKVTGDLAAAFINAAADRVDVAVGAAVTSAVPNAAIVAAVPTANPAAGDGVIELDILYRVIKTKEVA